MNPHERTLLVKRQKRFGRVDYTPCNDLAKQFLEGIRQKSFNEHDLKWIAHLGYTIALDDGQEIKYGLD